MFKKLLFFSFVLLFSKTLFAQNLVSNPSFEEFEQCLSRKQVEEIVINIPSLRMAKVRDWSCPSESGTADFFHVCFDSTNSSKPTFGTKAAFGVPRNNNGWQYPHSGKAYAGIYAVSTFFGNGDYREYLQGKLTEKLEKNKVYQVSFWCNLTDNSTLAVKDLGVYFSDKLLSYPDTFSKFIPVEPQIQNEKDRFLTNQRHWVKVTGTYKASGKEKYLLIGNFKPYNPQDYLVIFKDKNSFLFIASSYYFIDDVCVSLDPNECFANEKDTLDLDSRAEVFPYEPTKMRLKGKVLDETTKQPIPAQIGLKHDPKNYQTDEKGNFEIKTDTTSVYFLSFNQEGYFPHTERITNKVFKEMSISLRRFQKGSKGKISYFYEHQKGKMQVVPYHLEDLENWANFLKKHPDKQFQVNSHGLIFEERKLDSSLTVKEATELLKKKSLEKTEKLSQEIAEKLIGLGVNPQQIRHKGFGDTKTYGSFQNEIEYIGDLDPKTAEIAQKTEIWNIETLEVNQKIVLENLLFRPNSAEITPESLPILEKLLAFLNTNPKLRIAIHGHTDNGFGRTPAAVLQKLSEDRAVSVKKYLIGKGILENRLESKGFGMAQPVASNETDAGKSQNRRTELVILSK